MATLTAPPPHETIWGIANSIVATRSLHLIADLGVADHIGEEPVDAPELARRCGVDAQALERVLRLLSAHGIFEADGSRYRHSDASRLLRSDHPMSMRAFAQLNGLPLVWGALGALDHAVRTGAPGVEVVAPEGFFAYLQSHPDEAQVFDQAMSAKGRTDIASILAAYDFGSFRTIADIGGGRGHLLQAVLRAAPQAAGVLFDLPEVISTLDVASDRMRAQAGDFFADRLPVADAYILMEVIHDWPDAEACRILSAIRSAASEGASVLIIEDAASDEAVDPRSLTMDVLMLAVTGGRERTPTQHGELLRRAGFRMARVIETTGPMRMVEGVAV